MILEAARVRRVGAAVLAALALAACAEEPPLVDLRGGRPNVVLIVLDTFRADHLGCYGNAGVETPHIDALAAESILFENCSSNAPWTLPAFASLFTGRLPWSHHAVGGESKRMNGELPTMAELLAENGYATVGFVAVDWLGAHFGLDRGFQRQFSDFTGHVTGRHRKQLPKLGSFLRKRPAEPHLLLAHIYDAHAPYDPPAPYDRMYYDGDPHDPSNESMEPLYLGSNRIQRTAQLRYGWLDGVTDIQFPVAQYAAGISHVDAAVGAVLDSLRVNEKFDDSIVILTADHGEHLTEHSIYFTHRFPYEECLRVPLLVRLPGGLRGGERVSEEVTLVDLLPTLLELVDIPAPSVLDGISLVPLMRGRGLGVERLHFAEYGPQRRNHVRAVWDEDYRLIDFAVGDERWLELYDRRADRAEITNLAEERPELAGRLLNAIAERFPGGTILSPDASDSTAIAPDPELDARLRALGYVD